MFCESSRGRFVNIASDELFLPQPAPARKSMGWRASSIELVFMHYLRPNCLPGSPRAFLERHLVKGYLLAQEDSESPLQRFISFVKLSPNALQTSLIYFFLWSTIMPFNCRVHVWHCITFCLGDSWLSHGLLESGTTETASWLPTLLAMWTWRYSYQPQAPESSFIIEK